MLINMAQSIMDTVREFYTGHGPKSCNKVYLKSSKERVSWDDFEKKQTKFMTKLFSSSKHKKRNKDRGASGKLRFKNWSGDTPYNQGKSIWQAGNAGADVSGNCMEMAYVSAYLAIADFYVRPETVWFASIYPPGDHAFCLVGPSTQPTWTTPDEMGKFSASSNAAVCIDPWLHVACHAVNYPEFAGRTLKKWHSDGKRVFWCGKDFDGTEATAKPGWYDPSRSYSTSFLGAPLDFSPAT